MLAKKKPIYPRCWPSLCVGGLYTARLLREYRYVAEEGGIERGREGEGED